MLSEQLHVVKHNFCNHHLCFMLKCAFICIGSKNILGDLFSFLLLLLLILHLFLVYSYRAATANINFRIDSTEFSLPAALPPPKSGECPNKVLGTCPTRSLAALYDSGSSGPFMCLCWFALLLYALLDHARQIRVQSLLKTFYQMRLSRNSKLWPSH